MPSSEVIVDGSNLLPLIRNETRYECIRVDYRSFPPPWLASLSLNWRNIAIALIELISPTPPPKRERCDNIDRSMLLIVGSGIALPEKLQRFR